MSDQDAKNTAGSQSGKNTDENVHDHRAATEEASDPRKSQQSLLSPHDRTKSPTLVREDASQVYDVGIESTASNPTPGSEPRGTPDLRAQPKEKDQGKKKPAGPNEPFEQWERDGMEALLSEVQGHLGKSQSGILNNGFLTMTTSCISDTFLGG